MTNRLPPRVSYLDSLRAIAITAVIAAHSAQTVGGMQRSAGSDIDGWMLSFFNQGGYGVQVFFFLSGYLLAMLYGFSSLDRRDNRSTKTFWLKRLFRIVPLWILFLIVVILRPVLFPSSPGEWGNVDNFLPLPGLLGMAALVLLTLTFSMWLIPAAWGGFIPGGWSIQAEMLHYAFFAVVRNWRLEGILGAWLFLAIPLVFVDKLLIRVDVDLGVIEGWRSQNIASTLVFFLAGCIVYLLSDKGRREALSSTSIVLVGLGAATTFLLPLNNVKSGQMFAALGFVAYALILGYVLSRITFVKPLLFRIAKYSYFSYFFHFFLLDVIEGLWVTFVAVPVPGGQIGVGVMVIAVIAAVTGISTLVGAISWRIVEKPMISLGDRIAVDSENAKLKGK